MSRGNCIGYLKCTQHNQAAELQYFSHAGATYLSCWCNLPRRSITRQIALCVSELSIFYPDPCDQLTRLHKTSSVSKVCGVNWNSPEANHLRTGEC